MRVLYATAQTVEFVTTLTLEFNTSVNDGRVLAALSGLPFIVRMSCDDGLLVVGYAGPDDEAALLKRVVTLLKSGQGMVEYDQEVMLSSYTDRPAHQSRVPGPTRTQRRRVTSRHAAA